MPTMSSRTKLMIYEFLATPGLLWLWCATRLAGGRFECGPTGNLDEESED